MLHAHHTHRTPGGTLVCDDPRDLAAVQREITREYDLLPGLRLTFSQACRLWSLDPQRCAQALGALVTRGVLELSPDGAYRRAQRSQFKTA